MTIVAFIAGLMLGLFAGGSLMLSMVEDVERHRRAVRWQRPNWRVGEPD